MRRPLAPFPNALGWRVSANITGGLAHYFLGVDGSGKLAGYLCTICSGATLRHNHRLFPERMGRRRCKTCERSAARRGMQ